MIACYDLACCPPTYDFCVFLGHAELAKIKSNQRKVSIRILPGPNQGFRRDALWPKDIEERRNLLTNLVLPMCKLLPNSTVRVEKVRSDQFKSYFGYQKRFISLSNFMKLMQNNIRPLRCPYFVNKKPKLVTITLRESEHWQKRNSNVNEWLRAAVEIRKRGYDVVFIRDTRVANIPIYDFETSPEASVDLIKRSKLYASAALNIGINNGPIWMAILMDLPVMMIKPVCDELGGCYDTQFFQHCGLNKGDQLPTSPPYQRIVWEEDTSNNIIQAFDEVMECLNG